jgi:hypothetical protein
LKRGAQSIVSRKRIDIQFADPQLNTQNGIGLRYLEILPEKWKGSPSLSHRFSQFYVPGAHYQVSWSPKFAHALWMRFITHKNNQKLGSTIQKPNVPMENPPFTDDLSIKTLHLWRFLSPEIPRLQTTNFRDHLRHPTLLIRHHQPSVPMIFEGNR